MYSNFSVWKIWNKQPPIVLRLTIKVDAIFVMTYKWWCLKHIYSQKASLTIILHKLHYHDLASCHWYFVVILKPFVTQQFESALKKKDNWQCTAFANFMTPSLCNFLFPSSDRRRGFLPGAISGTGCDKFSHSSLLLSVQRVNNCRNVLLKWSVTNSKRAISYFGRNNHLKWP